MVVSHYAIFLVQSSAMAFLVGVLSASVLRSLLSFLRRS